MLKIFFPIFYRPEKFIENTISAFNYACKNVMYRRIESDHFYPNFTFFFLNAQGAQMIELDVQLSLDRIPVIYHDFEVQTNFVNVIQFSLGLFIKWL